MSNPIEFKFVEKSVRVEADDQGEPWFCAADVCGILGYTNASKAIADHCKEKGVTKRYTLTEGGNQELTYINEGNLYRLIIKSRKPEAEKFEGWVCDDVLPTIRKTGKYEMPKPQDRAEEYITRTQLDQIGNLVHEIMICCHYGESASHNTYAGIREQYGIENIHKLPAIHFEKAYGTLHVLREKAFEYLKLRTAIDKQFIKDVLRYHQLQMQCQTELFLPK